MSAAAVTYQNQDQIGLITLNRPDERNAMSPELLDAFERACEKAVADEKARAIVVTGSGSCFSAGANLRASIQRQNEGRLPHEASFAMYASFLRLLDIEVPVIGALNGHAVGGGFGLALLTDIRIANNDAKYGANFARLGLHSGMAISFLLPRIVGLSHASELLFTGKLIRGARAAEIGLMSHAVEANEVLTQAMKLAREIAEAAPIAVRTMKRSMRAAEAPLIITAARAEAHLQSETLQTDDAREGVAALLEKRDPVFHGR